MDEKQIARPRGRPRRSESHAKARKDGTNLRITVDFPPQSSERLRRLKEELESPSYVDVLRRALLIYDAAIHAQTHGGRVFFTDKDGKETNWAELL